jgi:hypothetical protein
MDLIEDVAELVIRVLAYGLILIQIGKEWV